MKGKRVEAGENKAPLFSNPENLEESINKKPLECQRTEVARLNKYIKQKMDQKKPSIVAYLTPYGSGKSVVLENAIKELPGSCKIIASAMIKEIISSGISLTSNPGDPRIRLVCRLFDIDLNKYPDSVRLRFGDLEPSYGDLNYRCHRHVTNSGWIVCDINLKYKDLMKSISH